LLTLWAPLSSSDTIKYDASKQDVRIRGVRRSKGFTYTSVIPYSWTSLPLANGQFRFDETLVPDNSSKEEKESGGGGNGGSGGDGGGDSGSGDGEEEEDRYTVFLTTSPTFQAGVNEIDVSEEPTGVCLIRLIYPDSQDVVVRCTPQVEAVPRRS
jgi:hypothetical protein